MDLYVTTLMLPVRVGVCRGLLEAFVNHPDLGSEAQLAVMRLKDRSYDPLRASLEK